MLANTTVLHLIHGVELSLKQNEFTCSWRVLIEQALLEFFQGIDYLEEVALGEEEFKVLMASLLYRK